MHRYLKIPFAILLAAWLAAPAQAQTPWKTFVSPDGSFSVLLPGTPSEEKVQKQSNVTTHLWQVVTKTGAFLFSYGDYVAVADDARLRTDVAEFLEAFKGTTADTQRDISFATKRGATLPGIELNFRNKNGVRGAAKIVAEGKRVFMWTAFDRQGQDAGADIARFLNSFAVLTPAPRP